MAESQKRSRGFLRFLQVAQSLSNTLWSNDSLEHFAIVKAEGQNAVADLAVSFARHGQLELVSGIEAAGGRGAVNFHANSMTDFLRKSTPFLRLSFFYFYA